MTYKVLIGDDDEMVRNSMRRALAAKSLDADLASTPIEMVTKARANNYDAIVTDLEYTAGGRQGYEVLDAIKDLPALKVLFTGQSGFEFAAEGFGYGADRVILRKDSVELIKLLEESSQAAVR